MFCSLIEAHLSCGCRIHLDKVPRSYEDVDSCPNHGRVSVKGYRHIPTDD